MYVLICIYNKGNGMETGELVFFSNLITKLKNKRIIKIYVGREFSDHLSLLLQSWESSSQEAR